MALCGPWLPEDPADAAFRMPEGVLDLNNCPAFLGRAQKFPRAASFKIELSIVKSAITFRNRVFSPSSSFRRFA